MKNENKNNIKMIIIIIFSFVVGGLVTLGILKWTPLMEQLLTTSNNGISSNTIVKNETQIYEKNSLAQAVEKAYDAVVLVKGMLNGEEISTGTAFVYKTDEKYGYLLTNNHVIEGTNEIILVMSDDEEVEGKVIGKDVYLDLAVIKMDKTKVKQVANIGSSEKMKIGDTVFAIGSPMGYDYRGSVTSGILSGKDRMISVSVKNSKGNDWIMRVLQIDASINPGNSGGPLLNANGEVIGICSLKLVDSKIEGMGFAIPIEYAMNHVDTLEKGKTIEWPVIGIEMINASNRTALYKNRIELSDKIKDGVVVISTLEGTGAREAGFRKGDVIVKINNKKIKDVAYLRYELYQYQAGDTIKVTYIRNGKEKTTDVKLGKSLND